MEEKKRLINYTIKMRDGISPVKISFFFKILFYFFSVPRFTIYAPYPVLHAICALHNIHHQAHPTSHHPPPKPSVCFSEPTSLMACLPLRFPPTHFSAPSPHVLCVISYAPQISETI